MLDLVDEDCKDDLGDEDDGNKDSGGGGGGGCFIGTLM